MTDYLESATMRDDLESATMRDDLESATTGFPMEMSDMSSWLIAHIVSIFAHFSLMLAGAVGFVTAATSFNSDDVSSCWMGSALGCIAMSFNIFYTSTCAKLEQRNVGATHESRRFIKQIVLAVGTTFNAIFVVVADFAFTAGAGTESSASATLIFVRLFSCIAGVSALVTVVMDAFKMYKTWKESRENYTLLDNMEPDDDY